MTEPSLVDWAPVWQLLAIGAAIAAIPLAWWAVRHRRAAPAQKMTALLALTLFLTFDLVVFGAFTRLTDSGLGCPDWPGCYGTVGAWSAKDQIDAAQAAMPSGPVTTAKAWIEMIHRKLATGIGAICTLLMLLGFWWRRQTGVSPWLGVAIFTWVCMQGAFGALTVTMKLFPAIVTLHLLGGVGLLALLAWQHNRYKKESKQTPQVLDILAKKPVFSQFEPFLKILLWVTFVALWIQIGLGGWVSTNYAVLACTEFPQCNGVWWPAMDFDNGFTVWRELGRQADGQSLSLPALTAIHMVHRLFAYLLIPLLLLCGWMLRASGVDARRGWCLVGLAGWQLVSGLSNVIFGWPIAAALAHSAGAAALVIALTQALVLHAGSRRVVGGQS